MKLFAGEQARRRDYNVDNKQLRVTDVCIQDGVACARHLGDQPSPPHQSYLRVVGWHQGDGIHVHLAQEHSQEVHRHLGPSSTGSSLVTVFSV